MKLKLFLLQLLFYYWSACFGQTNISGIINTYREVTAIGPNTCSTCPCYAEITVSPAITGAAVNFSAGDVALLIQMQGAVINQTNTTSFGDITNINNTGNFEYVRVIAVAGNVIRVSPLTLTYSLPSSPNPGKVQLVRVPVYAGDVNVTATLTATPWNGTTGGILTFFAAGKVIMNADMDVSGRGFRGYPHHDQSSGYCTEDDYFYSMATQFDYGAMKGEGVAITIPNMELGRGKQSNGGGGGIGHNGGGGGGGNGGAGGFGGQMYAGCVNLFGRGEGGAALAAGPLQVFMGGGGGAGDNNKTDPPDPGGDGMNGGGIIMVIADSIVNTINTIGYTGTTGPVYPATAQYLSNTYATQNLEFDVLCELQLNSVTVATGAANQTVVVSVISHDRATVLYGPVSVNVPTAGENIIPIGLTLPPGHSYMLSFAGTTGSLMFGNNNTGAYPYSVPDVITIKGSEPNAPGRNIAYAFNWNVTSRCASGGYRIDASGLDNPNDVNADGGGGGGGGGSIIIRSNGYRGIINMKATGGRGADMISGGCHAPGAGGGGGVICLNAVPPVNVYRNVSGAGPGTIPYDQATCLTPATGYNSHAATKGANGPSNCIKVLNEPSCSLPVELISFKGWKEEELHILEWYTASERNNDHFIIERSADGSAYQAIGKVNGNGSASTINRYRFHDNQPLKDLNYYRLKQVDHDGAIQYSNIIAVWNSTTYLEIVPNPNNGTYTLHFFPGNNSYSLHILDLNGKIVFTNSGDTLPEKLELNSFPKGVYTVQFNSLDQTTYKKLVVY